ncbi:MAG TPA: hypothetical protein DCL58_00095 [Synergistaceae bacterium]|uniref:hypothetical protein n=1 Tax=Synergistaceae TaxID=649777 RepID=UPI000EBD8972|nr:hypothetical protein [Synergistaceae bacterium DZ-S4]HAH68167.1 hypothetical protein [Synergistaceae bacterium]
MHKYKCASCGNVFKSDKTAEKCPKCRSRILIHQEGEPKKKGSYSCSGGNCSSCGGRCGC